MERALRKTRRPLGAESGGAVRDELMKGSRERVGRLWSWGAAPLSSLLLSLLAPGCSPSMEEDLTATLCLPGEPGCLSEISCVEVEGQLKCSPGPLPDEGADQGRDRGAPPDRGGLDARASADGGERGPVADEGPTGDQQPITDQGEARDQGDAPDQGEAQDQGERGDLRVESDHSPGGDRAVERADAAPPDLGAEPEQGVGDAGLDQARPSDAESPP